MVQRTGQTRVRNTNLKYEDLCCMRRVKGDAVIRKGTILARDGAWQNKRVVEYVKYMGVQDVKRYWDDGTDPMHLFAIGVRPLGQFFADGRMKISRKQELAELHLYLDDPTKSPHNIGGWEVVEVIPPASRQIGHIHCDPAKGTRWQAQARNDQLIPMDPTVGKLCNLKPKTSGELWAYNQWAKKVGRPLLTEEVIPSTYVTPNRVNQDPEEILAKFQVKGLI